MRQPKIDRAHPSTVFHKQSTVVSEGCGGGFFSKGIFGSADKGIGGAHMHIQSYQIHNVLNVYRRQLSQGKPGPTQHVSHNRRSDSIRISAEAKNQSIMEKVTANVLKKITNVTSGSEFEQEMNKQIQNATTDLTNLQKENAFIFNTIEADNQKETRSIAVDDSQGLMNRLDELARKAVKRMAETNGS
ncbi:DVU0524 family FlgM-associated protein [Desulfosarcina sp.]|uniref:DVU0524 family FlgM-associated protein n=1 Tax=Desulfosarcina sp. TaxID=2027861 RepID=UPI0039707A2B